VIACDYGEAVGDPVATPEALAERSLCLAMSHSVLAVCPGQPQVAALLAEVERLYPAA
jgi:hypothetical protein